MEDYTIIFVIVIIILSVVWLYNREHMSEWGIVGTTFGVIAGMGVLAAAFVGYMKYRTYRKVLDGAIELAETVVGNNAGTDK